LIGHYARAISVYLLIIGGLLKFALDRDATVPLRHALGAMGLSIGIVGFAAVALAERQRRQTKSEIEQLYKHLSVPVTPDTLMAQNNGILMCCLVFVVGTAGWIYVLTF
jgi:hypothetical protein